MSAEQSVGTPSDTSHPLTGMAQRSWRRSSVGSGGLSREEIKRLFLPQDINALDKRGAEAQPQPPPLRGVKDTAVAAAEPAAAAGRRGTSPPPRPPQPPHRGDQPPAGSARLPTESPPAGGAPPLPTAPCLSSPRRPHPRRSSRGDRPPFSRRPARFHQPAAGAVPTAAPWRNAAGVCSAHHGTASGTEPAAPGAGQSAAEQVRESVGGEGLLTPAPYLAAVRRTAAARPAPLFKHLRQAARTWAVAAQGRAEQSQGEPSRAAPADHGRGGGCCGTASPGAERPARRRPRPAGVAPRPPRPAAARALPALPGRSGWGRSLRGRLRPQRSDPSLGGCAGVGALPAAPAGEEEEEVRGDAMLVTPPRGR